MKKEKKETFFTFIFILYFIGVFSAASISSRLQDEIIISAFFLFLFCFALITLVFIIAVNVVHVISNLGEIDNQKDKKE